MTSRWCSLPGLALIACASTPMHATRPASSPATAPVPAAAPGPYHDPDRKRGELPTADRRETELAALHADLTAVYAHRLEKEQRYSLDEPALFAATERRLLAATSWAGYDSAIYDLLAQFHDDHLTYHPPSTAAPSAGWVSFRLGLATVLAGDHLLISSVEPSGALAAAGVAPGDEVVAIDGIAVSAVLAREVKRRVWSRPESARTSWARTWTSLLYGKGEAPRVRTLAIAARVSGAVRDVAITPVEAVHAKRDAVVGTVTGDVAMLAFRLLEGRNAEKEIDVALATARTMHRLVIDFRGVRGGVDRVGYRVVAGLAEGTAAMGKARVLLAPETRAARPKWHDLAAEADGFSAPIALDVQAQPPGQGFHGKVAVIVDAGCASTCEVVTAALRANLHAVVVGETTAGSSGAPIELALPVTGGNIAVPTWNLIAADGHPIEGDGVVPDLVVVPTADALAAGRDAPLDAAIARTAP